MKKLDLVLAWALVAVGAVWSAIALGAELRIAPNNGFSIAFGTAVFATGFLNTIRASGAKPVVRLGCIFCNLLLMVSFSSGLIAQTTSPHFHLGPRLIVLIVLVVPEFLLSIIVR